MRSITHHVSVLCAVGFIAVGALPARAQQRLRSCSSAQIDTFTPSSGSPIAFDHVFPTPQNPDCAAFAAKIGPSTRSAAAPPAAASLKIRIDEEDQGRVVEALSGIDAPPPCAAVEKLAAHPVAVLLAIVDHVAVPARVPMRAAACLVTGHAAEIEPSITAWLRASDKRGLAILTMRHLDAMPNEVARRLVRAGVVGPHGPVLTDRLARMDSAWLRATTMGVTR